MARINRDPVSAARTKYDLIIVGGGIYGVALSLEASRRGLRSLLLEKADFGSKTSFNSLRILHGGLRYLQTADLRRFRESVAERSWFLRMFPDLVCVQPCLMPLYGNGAKRPSVFRAALRANDLLSFSRNKGVFPELNLPNGEVVNEEKTRELFPFVDTGGLKGGAIWYDVCMPDSQRILIEMLRLSCAHGGTALNYVEASDVKVGSGCVVGISGVDAIDGTTYDFSADVVINVAGPWCRQFAKKSDREFPELFHASLAWNVLFNREALSSHALAVAPKISGAKTYFLVPWKGKILAGTVHTPWISGVLEDPKPTRKQVDEFLSHLNLAIPSLSVRPGNIEHIFSGLLPSRAEGTADIAKREVILAHEKSGGAKGLYSVSGVKFTTSRLVADKVLRLAFPNCGGNKYLSEQTLSSQIKKQSIGHFEVENDLKNLEQLEFRLNKISEEESVRFFSDLYFRRTNLWESSFVDKKVFEDILSKLDINKDQLEKNIYTDLSTD